MLDLMDVKVGLAEFVCFAIIQCKGTNCLSQEKAEKEHKEELGRLRQQLSTKEERIDTLEVIKIHKSRGPYGKYTEYYLPFVTTGKDGQHEQARREPSASQDMGRESADSRAML